MRQPAVGWRFALSALAALSTFALVAARGGAAPAHQHVNIPQHAAPSHTPHPFAPNVDYGMVLARYRTALDHYHTPDVLTYVFSIDQAGDRGLSQTHVIYRSGTTVRDEMTAMGSVAVKPHIHIYRNRKQRYAIEQVAPRATAYRFRYINAHEEAGHLVYHFDTQALTPGAAFYVTGVDIDGERFLPVDIAYHARTADLEGSGHLRYGPVDDAWMIIEASADSRRPHGTLREHIHFAEYHFPKSLPEATFGGV